MDKNKIWDLLKKHISGKLSEPESLILWMELGKGENASEIKALILDLSYETEASGSYKPDDWEEMIASILTAGKVENPSKLINLNAANVSNSSLRPYLRRKRPFLWGAAAAILILLFGSFYLIYSPKATVPVVRKEMSKFENDVAPGFSKATLYLANGQQINLDSAHNGQLASVGGAKIIKTDSGKLLYSSAKQADSSSVSLNTLSTPRGGIFQITLPDGTQAWLNASSSIIYPTRFVQKQRQVSITGEVYFEVAKDIAHPFIVTLHANTKNWSQGGQWMQIEVLGTHFNVKAYGDSGDLTRTTLLEGSVKVLAHGMSRTITPNEQASTSFTEPHIGVTDKVDIEKVMAWKNGEMVLTNNTVQQIMQEISRWYDVDVKFSDKIPSKSFYGSVDRNVPLSSVLTALKAYGVQTKLEGKTIVVE